MPAKKAVGKSERKGLAAKSRTSKVAASKSAASNKTTRKTATKASLARKRKLVKVAKKSSTVRTAKPGILKRARIIARSAMAGAAAGAATLFHGTETPESNSQENPKESGRGTGPNED